MPATTHNAGRLVKRLSEYGYTREFGIPDTEEMVVIHGGGGKEGWGYGAWGWTGVWCDGGVLGAVCGAACGAWFVVRGV